MARCAGPLLRSYHFGQCRRTGQTMDGAHPRPGHQEHIKETTPGSFDPGTMIANGKADLDQLNQRSLELRAKGRPKRKHAEPENEPSSKPVKKPKAPSAEDIRSHFFSDSPKIALPRTKPPTPEILQARDTIASSKDLTAFRRFALILLTYIPPGCYSTYGAMSSYITANHHKCSARAIGNAMRNNAFAPTVPCHRVLAHDGRIGGFGGDCGEQGKHSAEKRRLLAEEGVRFDSGGKVIGKPYNDFQDNAEVTTWYRQILGNSKKQSM